MTKFSVIMPVHNTEQYLKEALDSLFSQEFKDLEVICINNFSKDRSLEILEEYAKKDNRVIVINASKKGVSCARNIGLEKASGEYIHFFDSDDYVSSNFYFDLFEKLEKSNADLVICGCKKVYDWNKKIEDYDFFNHNKKELDLFVTSTVWTYVFKNKFKMKFDEAISYGEDDLFSFKLFKKIKNYAYEPKAIYYYRQRLDSAMNSDLKINTYANGRLKILESLYEEAMFEDNLKKYEYSYFKIFDLQFCAINSYRFLSLAFFLKYMKLSEQICDLFKEGQYHKKLLEYKKVSLRQIRKNIISINIKNRYLKVKLFNRVIFKIGEAKI